MTPPVRPQAPALSLRLIQAYQRFLQQRPDATNARGPMVRQLTAEMDAMNTDRAAANHWLNNAYAGGGDGTRPGDGVGSVEVGPTEDRAAADSVGAQQRYNAILAALGGYLRR